MFFYLEDRERTFDSPTDKLLMSVTAFADELERLKAGLRAYDAMSRRAGAGHVCGRQNLRIPQPRGGARRPRENGRTSSGGLTRRRPSVVTCIFEMSAAGAGLTRITKALNEDGVLAPPAAAGPPGRLGRRPAVRVGAVAGIPSGA